jgi:hypothetical protein
MGRGVQDVAFVRSRKQFNTSFFIAHSSTYVGKCVFYVWG